MGYLVDVDFTLGPLPAILHPGRADRETDTWLADVMDTVATKGLAELQKWMDAYFRDPTPYYETQVTWDRAGTDRIIHDRGIVYGPWLDGSGSRNQTTRFKGYAHWRNTRQALQDQFIPQVLDAATDDLLARLGALV